MNPFTESLRALVVERDRVNHQGQDLFLKVLDLTKSFHDEIDAAHERYRQGLLALGSGGATTRPPSMPLQPVNGASAHSVEQSAAPSGQVPRVYNGDINQAVEQVLQSEPHTHNGSSRWFNRQH